MPLPSTRAAAFALAGALAAGCAGTGKPQPPGPPPPPLEATASPVPVPAGPPSTEPNPFERCARQRRGDVVPVLDQTRRVMHETVCGAALWFDSLFGEGDVRVARRSYGYLETSASYSDYEGEDYRVRFHARVRLPALEDRVSAFVGRDSDEDVERDRREGGGLQSLFRRRDDDDSFFAGLGYAFPDHWRVQTDFKVGARKLTDPIVFAQLRVQLTPYLDERHQVLVRLTPFVNNQERGGFTTNADADRTFGDRFLLRFANAGTITQENEGVDWRSALVLYHNVRRGRALAYEAFARGMTNAPVELIEYGARLIYRHALLQEKLVAEPSAGYTWPREDPAVPREGSPGVGFGITIPFGTQPKSR